MRDMDEMATVMGMGAAEGFPQVAMPLCDRTVLHEVVKEITVADYEPEIRRVLSVSETVMPPARYVGSGRVELNGGVEYRLLCVTTEGNLHTVTATAEYEWEAPFENRGGEIDVGDGACVFASTVTEHLSARLTAPRRVSLRHKLCSRVRCYGMMTLNESGVGEPLEGIQRLTVESERMVPFGASSEPISVREDCPLPNGESRVTAAEACVFVSSALSRDGALAASGDVILRLMTDRDGTVEMVQRRIPFEGEIEGEGFSEGAQACAEGVMENLTVTVEDGRALCEGEIILMGRTLRSMPLRYTEDLYSTEAECECEYTERQIPVAIKCENRNLSQSERLSLADAKIPEGAEILDVWGTVRVEGCEQKDDAYVWTGKSRYRILCKNEGEYSATEVELPFRYESDGDGRELMSADCRAQVISCRARMDGENLALDAEIAICADYVGSCPIRWVSSVKKGQLRGKNRPCMVVYYPTSEDTSWSVAKKYGVPQEKLQGDLGSYFVF